MFYIYMFMKVLIQLIITCLGYHNRQKSGAKIAGTDMIFMLCSEECGHELKEI